MPTTSRLAPLALVPILAVACLFRLTSLETAPAPHADEAFFGVQAARIVQGKGPEWWTHNGNPLNVFLVGGQLPLVAAFEPSFTCLRLPAALSGILAVLAAGVLGARVLDRPTALIAAVALAVLPIAILYSRIAWDPCHVIPGGVICLYFAFRGRPWALLVAYLATVLAYHTSFMTAPILLSVLLVRHARDHADAPPRRLRGRLAAIAAVAVLVVGAIVLWEVARPAYRYTQPAVASEPQDWLLFLARFEQMLLGHLPEQDQVAGISLGRAFWVGTLSVLVPGSWALARQRRWEQLALVVSLLMTLAGTHLVLGPGVLRPEWNRYGLFLAAPTCFALACLVRSLLLAPTSRLRRAGLSVQVIALLALAVGGLGLTWRAGFAPQIQAAGNVERLWTLRSETKEPAYDLYVLLTQLDGPTDPTAGTAQNRESGQQRTTRRTIVACDWWHYGPLKFYASWRPDLVILGCHRAPAARRPEVLMRALARGAYVVADGSFDPTAATNALPPGILRRWAPEAPSLWVASTSVYRHDPAPTLGARAQPDAAARR